MTSVVKGARTTVSPSNSMLMVSNDAGADLLPEALGSPHGVYGQSGDACGVDPLFGHAADEQSLVGDQESRLDTGNGQIPFQSLLQGIQRSPRRLSLLVIVSHSGLLFYARLEKLQLDELRGALSLRPLTITYFQPFREPCELRDEHAGPHHRGLAGLRGS